MSFSGRSSDKIDYSLISVYKNGYNKFYISDHNTAEKAAGNNVCYIWMMSLVEGDEVKLRSLNNIYASINNPITFAGELIHIENCKKNF